MRVTRHLSICALAGALAVGLAACSDTGQPATEPVTPAEPVVTDQPDPIDSATAEPEPTASVADGQSDDPSASPSDVASPGDGQATPTHPGDGADTTAVTGAADVTSEWVHVGDDGSEACALTSDDVTCYLRALPGESECSGDTPMVTAQFQGSQATRSCSAEGDAGAVPFATTGQVVEDPTGVMRCEVVDTPSVGLRCTDSRSGATALLTAAQTRTL